MLLAGIRVPDTLVLALAARLRRNYRPITAKHLAAALAANSETVGLTITDREAILSVLKDPPAGLEDLLCVPTDPPAGLDDLRAVLLNEHTWRSTEGL